MNKEVCPICDGIRYQFVESGKKVSCWACKGKGEVIYVNEETEVSENEIKTMYSALGQR